MPQIVILPLDERATHLLHAETITAPHPQDMKAAATILIDTETESEEVNVATGTEETATEVTVIQKSLHTTEVPIATAAAETMAHRQVEEIMAAQVEEIMAVQVEETMARQAEEENTVQAVEITVPVAHMARIHTRHLEIESLGMIAEEVGQIDLMDREGEECLEVEAMEDETGIEVFHPRDREARLQI